jgi:hypothetical protein
MKVGWLGLRSDLPSLYLRGHDHRIDMPNSRGEVDLFEKDRAVTHESRIRVW